MAVSDEQKMNSQKGRAEGDQGRRADESASDAMHRLLGRLVHAYARLDHYVGLQLKWLGDYRAQPVEQLLRKTIPFDMRLRRLKRLAIETWGHTDQAVANEFREWFAAVERIQKQRNNFAHGRWGDPRTSADVVQFVELTFETDADETKPELTISLAEFGRLVSEVEGLSASFMALQKKFERRVRYRKDREDASPAGYANWVAYQGALSKRKSHATGARGDRAAAAG
ncbi:hypothetical protein [Variovorax sp. 350MFTsu5.1]|uniref:hypothetical protein n=1 Tax=Variovorax sp. 350MFTsu5.1 TaxID=3158365 RepID=UPI003AAD3423